MAYEFMLECHHSVMRDALRCDRPMATVRCKECNNEFRKVVEKVPRMLYKNEREYTECPHCGVRCITLVKHRGKCHPEKVHRY